MASLRPVEERDAKGNTIRVNASITFKQHPEIRKIVGRHDWRLEPNPDFHQPITAQAQENKVFFFAGVPDSATTRALAKELPHAEIPAYIMKELTERPMKVRETRPTVFEVRIATIGDVEVTRVDELEGNGAEVVVSAKEPNLTPPDLSSTRRGGRPLAHAEAAAS